ncbi:MAG: DUF885 domain-containing protein, partial [Arenicella sp.]|nr:DUF885 domain-containing protein [Arenicella sp.]
MKQSRINLLSAFMLLAITAACGESSQLTSQQAPQKTIASTASSPSANEQADALFDRIFEQAVSRSPEFQTALGRSTNMDKWNDLSDAFDLETLELDKANLAELMAIDPTALDKSTALSYELMQQRLEESIDDFEWRFHNYPVNQMFGRHSGVPSLLINMHRVSTVKNAQDYVARLNAVPAYFDQLIAGLKQRAERNILPPKFVFPHVIRDSKNVISGAPFDDGDDSTLLADFKSKLAALKDNPEAGLTDEQESELHEAAVAALTTQVRPAYEKLVATLGELEKSATTDDGIWKVPEGERFYNVALKRTTTTDMTAEQIHQLGLSEVARIHDEMRQIKETVGFEGDLAAFMKYVRESEDFVYPNTAEGKARYLQEATDLIETMKSRLDELFLRLPKADITVKAVEPFREQSAGKAFYQRPSEDGSRPGLYYANLYDMEAMPTYQ